MNVSTIFSILYIYAVIVRGIDEILRDLSEEDKVITIEFLRAIGGERERGREEEEGSNENVENDFVELTSIVNSYRVEIEMGRLLGLRIPNNPRLFSNWEKVVILSNYREGGVDGEDLEYDTVENYNIHLKLDELLAAISANTIFEIELRNIVITSVSVLHRFNSLRVLRVIRVLYWVLEGEDINFYRSLKYIRNLEYLYMIDSEIRNYEVSVMESDKISSKLKSVGFVEMEPSDVNGFLWIFNQKHISITLKNLKRKYSDIFIDFYEYPSVLKNLTLIDVDVSLIGIVPFASIDNFSYFSLEVSEGDGRILSNEILLQYMFSIVAEKTKSVSLHISCIEDLLPSLPNSKAETIKIFCGSNEYIKMNVDSAVGNKLSLSFGLDLEYFRIFLDYPQIGEILNRNNNLEIKIKEKDGEIDELLKILLIYFKGTSIIIEFEEFSRIYIEKIEEILQIERTVRSIEFKNINLELFNFLIGEEERRVTIQGDKDVAVNIGAIEE